MPRGRTAYSRSTARTFSATEDQLTAVEAALDWADVLLLQMEVPFHISMAAARAARARSVTTMLDPAPASDIPPEAFRDLDIITPNQTEAEYHTDIRVDDIPSARAAAEALLERGVGTAIVKMAEQGVYWASQEGSGHVPAYEVEVVDTISAGDAFSGALAVALGERRGMEEAIRYASAAGALAVTRRGVQTAMPTRAEVDDGRPWSAVNTSWLLRRVRRLRLAADAVDRGDQIA